jgi:hypothetical protein
MNTRVILYCITVFFHSDIGIEGKEPLLISSWNFQTLYNQRYLFEYSKLVVFFNYNIHYCWQVVLECSLH